MHKEIEALQRAYDNEVHREREFVHDVLLSLSQGAIARRRMVDDLTEAIVRLRQQEARPAPDPLQESLDDLAQYDWDSAYNGQERHQGER